jgi:putative tricarboxylic transport membrane protein
VSAQWQKRAVLRSDAVAGVLIMIVAAVFFYGASKLRAGTLDRMGPGYVPIAMAIFLFVMGVVLTIQAFVTRGEGAQFPSLRPTLVVVLSPLLFALLIGRVGLVLTVLIVTAFARFAEPQKRGLEMVLLPVLMTVFCVIVFIYLLNLTIPLWP